MLGLFLLLFKKILFVKMSKPALFTKPQNISLGLKIRHCILPFNINFQNFVRKRDPCYLFSKLCFPDYQSEKQSKEFTVIYTIKDEKGKKKILLLFSR